MTIDEQIREMERRKHLALLRMKIADQIQDLTVFGAHRPAPGSKIVSMKIGGHNWLPQVEGQTADQVNEIMDCFQVVVDSINGALEGVIEEHVRVFRQQAQEALNPPPADPVKVTVTAPANVDIDVQTR